jgi:hypothetical protein
MAATEGRPGLNSGHPTVRRRVKFGSVRQAAKTAAYLTDI